MKKPLSKKREEARKLFLSGELTTNAEIAQLLKVKPHTVGTWRKEEDWDDLRLKLDRRAAELFVEKIASDRVALNLRHYRLWDLVVSGLMEELKTKKNLGLEEIVKISGVLSRAQTGQRLAKGLGLQGETEEAIRAKSQAELRTVVDVVIEAIKENVPDEQARDRIRRALVESLPADDDEDEEMDLN